MSFQGYLNSIERITGKTAADFRALATELGFMDGALLREEIKAKQIIDWLKSDFGLGHGHSMAIFTLLKGRKKEGD
jgi:hypothetical protein